MDPAPWKRPVATTFFGILAASSLALMPFLAGPPGKPLPDWVSFIGHFHPVVLHLPIGVFLLIVTQELGVMLFRRRGSFRPPGNFPLFFGAASAVVAVITGFMLYQGGGEDYGGNDVATRHLWGGIVFAIAAIATFLVKCWTKPDGKTTWYRVMLFGSVAVMGFSSHDGGTLTHGEGFLTKHAPSSLKKLLGEKVEPAKEKKENTLPTAAAPENDPVVFTAVITPILERYCVSCHKEGKAKGKLRLDTYEALMKGGADGSAVEPSKSAESLLIERMELPTDDDEAMPPKGKPRQKEAELRVLKWWIDSGASKDMTASQLNIPAALKTDLAALAAAPETKESEDKGHAAPEEPPPPRS